MRAIRARTHSKAYYPFTAPLIIPLTSLSWKTMNSMIIGSTDKMIGISIECSPLNYPSASGSVFWAADCSRVLAKANSFHMVTPL